MPDGGCWGLARMQLAAQGTQEGNSAHPLLSATGKTMRWDFGLKYNSIPAYTNLIYHPSPPSPHHHPATTTTTTSSSAASSATSHAAAHAATIQNNSAPRFLTAIAVRNRGAELR